MMLETRASLDAMRPRIVLRRPVPREARAPWGLKRASSGSTVTSLTAHLHFPACAASPIVATFLRRLTAPLATSPDDPRILIWNDLSSQDRVVLLALSRGPRGDVSLTSWPSPFIECA